MFKEDEGMSTFIIADFLHNRPGGGQFVSIDYDLEHIEACRRLIALRHPALSSNVEFRHGHSVTLLPAVLAKLQTVHFALLDGGAHPEICLIEFEQTIAHLANKGVVLVDDAQPMPPSPGYGLLRPFGKATLILPMLIVAHYVENRAAAHQASSWPGDEASVPDSRFIRQLLDLESCERALPFGLVGGKHKMLVYGSSDFVTEVEEWLKTAADGSRSSAPMLKRIVKKVLRVA